MHGILTQSRNSCLIVPGDSEAVQSPATLGMRRIVAINELPTRA
jgi:hypothetical protein